jgi:hypothetical protein
MSADEPQDPRAKNRPSSADLLTEGRNLPATNLRIPAPPLKEPKPTESATPTHVPTQHKSV